MSHPHFKIIEKELRERGGTSIMSSTEKLPKLSCSLKE
jgi:hypothetical protein